MNHYYDTESKLAGILGVTDRWIRKQTQEKVLLREPSGLYNIPDNVERYYRSKFDGNTNLLRERALHERAKRKLAEIVLAKQRAEIHLADDVELMMNGLLVTFHSRLLSLPAKLAPQVMGMETIAEIAGVLEVAVTEALSELSEYDPAEFAKVSQKHPLDKRGEIE